MTEETSNTAVTEQPILVDLRDECCVLTLNRPAQRNALNTALLHELLRVFGELKGLAKVIVLTGAGDTAFCAGMDLKEARASLAQREYSSEGNVFFQVIEAMRRHPAVFICAVNGFALGGGLTLTHNAELALATTRATFGMPEIGFGVFPALAGPATLQRIGPKNAAWMVLTGKRVDAQTALSWGVVNEVLNPEQLMPRAFELAEHIAQFDSVALDYSKKALREVVTMEWSRSIEYGLNINAVIARQTQAGRQGIDKFAQGGRNVGQGGKH